MTQAPSIEITAKDFARLVKPLIPLASSDWTLPILNAIRFEPRGNTLRACATDRFKVGMTRLRLDVEPTGVEPFTLSISVIREIMSTFKPGRFDDPALKITTSKSSILVEQTGGIDFLTATVEYATVSGDYPRIGKVIAAFEPGAGEPAGFNAAYLADFKHAVIERGEPLVVQHGKPGKPTLVTCGDHFIGALMPVRIDGEAVVAGLEEWADLLVEAPVETKAAAA